MYPHRCSSHPHFRRSSPFDESSSLTQLGVAAKATTQRRETKSALFTLQPFMLDEDTILSQTGSLLSKLPGKNASVPMIRVEATSSAAGDSAAVYVISRSVILRVTVASHSSHPPYLCPLPTLVTDPSAV